MSSIFAKYEERAYPYRYNAALHIRQIAGGVPTDPKVAEGWIRTKLAAKDDLIQEEVATIMLERGISAEEAASEADKLRHLNGFKRNQNGELYIEGFQLKAAIKEAANVRWPKKKWGPSSKGTIGFFAEHVFVIQDRLGLGVKEPDEVVQRFVHTWRGNAIQYEEVVYDAEVEFTIETDHEFSDEEWAMLWLTGQQQGLGAARSQGDRRYEVTRWDRV